MKRWPGYLWGVCLLLIFVSLVACGPGAAENPPASASPGVSPSASPGVLPTPLIIASPTLPATSSPTPLPSPTPTAAETSPTELGSLSVSPGSSLDGGWIGISGQEPLLIEWVTGPIEGAAGPAGRIAYADFYLAPTGTSGYDARQALGRDEAPADGLALNWQPLPGGFTAHLWAEGYDDQGRLVAFSPTVQLYAEAAPGQEGGPVTGLEVINPLTVDRLALQYALPLPADITDLAWSPDNKTLAVATTNGVALFDPETRSQTSVVALGLRVGRLEFSPDGRYLLLHPAEQDAAPLLWDLDAKGEAEAWADKLAGVSGVTFSPDGARLLTGTAPVDLNIWNLADGAAEAVLDLTPLGIATSGDQTQIRRLSYLPDGQTLLVETGSPDGIQWWLLDLASSQFPSQISPAGYIAGPIALPLFAPADWQHVYWLSRGSVIKVDLASGEQQGAFQHTDFVMGAAFSPNGLLLATISAQTMGQEYGPALIFWDLSQGQQIWSLNDLVKMPTALAFSPDGTRLAYATNGEGVAILGISAAP